MSAASTAPEDESARAPRRGRRGAGGGPEGRSHLPANPVAFRALTDALAALDDRGERTPCRTVGPTTAWTSDSADDLQLAAMYCSSCAVLVECRAAGDGEAAGASWGAVANLSHGSGARSGRWDALAQARTAPPRPSAAVVRSEVISTVQRLHAAGEAVTVTTVVAATGHGSHRVRRTLLALVDEGELAVDRAPLAWHFSTVKSERSGPSA